MDPITAAILGGSSLLGSILGGGPEPQQRQTFTLADEHGGGSIANNIARYLNEALAGEHQFQQQRRDNFKPFRQQRPAQPTAQVGGAIGDIGQARGMALASIMSLMGRQPVSEVNRRA